MQKKKIAVPTMVDRNGRIKKVYLPEIEVTAKALPKNKQRKTKSGIVRDFINDILTLSGGFGNPLEMPKEIRWKGNYDGTIGSMFNNTDYAKDYVGPSFVESYVYGSPLSSNLGTYVYDNDFAPIQTAVSNLDPDKIHKIVLKTKGAVKNQNNILPIGIESRDQASDMELEGYDDKIDFSDLRKSNSYDFGNYTRQYGIRNDSIFYRNFDIFDIGKDTPLKYGLPEELGGKKNSIPNVLTRIAASIVNKMGYPIVLRTPWQYYGGKQDLKNYLDAKKEWEEYDYNFFINELGLSEEEAKEKIKKNRGYQHFNEFQKGGQMNNIETFGLPMYGKGGKIHIKPENRGKFTALKKRTGKSASWFKAHGTPAQKKMATFALNAKKWKHQEGGDITNPEYESMAPIVTFLNRDKNFVQRALYPELYPYIPIGENDRKTHLMEYSTDDNGYARVYPTIVQKKDSDNLEELNSDGAYNYATNTGEYIDIPNIPFADWYSKNGLINHIKKQDGTTVTNQKKTWNEKELNPNINTDNKTSWFEWWYSDRNKQIKNALKNAGIENPTDDMVSYYMNDFYNKIKNTEESYDFNKSVPGTYGVIGGYYSPGPEFIGAQYPATIKYYIDRPTTKIHERSHAGNFTRLDNQNNNQSALENMIYANGYDKYQFQHVPNDEKYNRYIDYINSPTEKYARLMQFRYDNHINPRHIWTREEIEEWLKNGKFDGYNLGDDVDNLLHLFNDVAENNTINEFDNNKAQIGGIIDPLGQWAHPGEVTTIPSNEITMDGVSYPVLGVSNTGETKLMIPGFNYQFGGDYVTEYPLKHQTNPIVNIDNTRVNIPINSVIEKKHSQKQTLKDRIRDRLYWNIEPFGYNSPLKRVFNAVIMNKQEPYQKETDEYLKKHSDIPVYDSPLDALWATYLQIPEENRRPIHPSASLIKNKDGYYSFKSPRIILNDWVMSQAMSPEGVYKNDKRLFRAMNSILGDYTIGLDKDENGEYVYYRDSSLNKDGSINLNTGWDINPWSKSIDTETYDEGSDEYGVYGQDLKNLSFKLLKRLVGDKNDVSMGIGKVVPIYGKMYLDDYYNVGNKRKIPQSTIYGGWLPEIEVKANADVKKLEGSFVPIPTVDKKLSGYNSAMTQGLIEGDMLANTVGTALGAASSLAMSIGGAARAKKQENIDDSTTDNSTDSSTENTTTNTFDPFAKPNVIEQTMRDLTGVDQLKHNLQRNFNFTNRMYGIIGNKLAMPKFMARGGMPSTQAIVEGGEIIEEPDGSLLLVVGRKHEYSGDRLYTPEGNIDGEEIEVSGDSNKDKQENPNVIEIKKPDRIARKGDMPFIWPSTVNQFGYKNTKIGDYFPESHIENKENSLYYPLQKMRIKKNAKKNLGGKMQLGFTTPQVNFFAQKQKLSPEAQKQYNALVNAVIEDNKKKEHTAWDNVKAKAKEIGNWLIYDDTRGKDYAQKPYTLNDYYQDKKQMEENASVPLRYMANAATYLNPATSLLATGLDIASAPKEDMDEMFTRVPTDIVKGIVKNTATQGWKGLGKSLVPLMLYPFANKFYNTTSEVLTGKDIEQNMNAVGVHPKLSHTIGQFAGGMTAGRLVKGYSRTPENGELNSGVNPFKYDINLLKKYISNEFSKKNILKKDKKDFNNYKDDTSKNDIKLEIDMDSRFMIPKISDLINYDLEKISIEDAEKIFGPDGGVLKQIWDIAKKSNNIEVQKDIENELKELFPIPKDDVDINEGINRSKRIYNIPEYRKRFDKFGTLGETFLDDARWRLNNIILQGKNNIIGQYGLSGGASASVYPHGSGKKPIMKFTQKATSKSSLLKYFAQHEANHIGHGTHIAEPDFIKYHNEKIRPKPIEGEERTNTPGGKYMKEMDEIIARSKTAIEYADKTRKQGESLNESLERLANKVYEEPYNQNIPADIRGLALFFEKQSMLNFWKNFIGGFSIPITMSIASSLNNTDNKQYQFGGIPTKPAKIKRK